MLQSILFALIKVYLDCINVDVVLIVSDCNLCRNLILKKQRYII